MWPSIFVVCSVFMLYQFGCVDNSGIISIPLYRQKTPRENALNNPNIQQLGGSLKWITKPHKHNITNDSIALHRFLDTEFYGEVLIGHVGKSVNMIFDTSWSTSWVISADCSWKTIGCWFHNKYDHHLSSTYVSNGTAFTVNEGYYNLTGYFSNDTFLLGHSRVNGQMFVEMTSIPYSYILSKADGVMGLGFKTTNYKPFFYNLLEQSKIKKALFSVYLNRDRQSSRGGNIILGFIDHKHIHQLPSPDPKKPIFENITYLPVDSSVGYWLFDIDRIVVDDTAKHKSYPFCTGGCKAFPDTSNTIIVGPKGAIDAIHTLLQAKLTFFGIYKVNCDTIDNLPPITFILAGKEFMLKGSQYTQKVSVGSLTLCVSAFRSSDLPYEKDSWILGGAFLSEFYSIYDLENSRIGFVRAA